MAPKLVVYSLVGCGYSMAAENLLSKLGAKADIIKVAQADKQGIKDKNGMNTFPQVFLEEDDKKILIGGFDDLERITELSNSLKEAYKKDGTFKDLLKSGAPNLDAKTLLKMLIVLNSN